MSYEAINAVLKHSKAKGTRRMLLLVIAHHAHEDGTGARPNLDTLCKETGIENSNLRKYLRDLKRLGELNWVSGRKNRASEYSISLPEDDIYTGEDTRVNEPTMINTRVNTPTKDENTRLYLPTQHMHDDVYVNAMHDASGINAFSAPNVSETAPESANGAAANALDALLSHGVDEWVARALANEKPEECLRQVGYLPLRGAVRNVPALLVRAIQQSWQEPLSKTKSSTNSAAPKTESSTRPATAPIASAPSQITPQPQAPTVAPPPGIVDLSHDPKAREIAREDAENAALNAQFEAMPNAERAALRALAEERMSYAPSFLRGESAIRSMIRTLMREEKE